VTFLQQYLDGDREGAWANMMALGDRVREAEHYQDARATAEETMQRVRGNIEHLVNRLTSIGYHFAERPHTLPGSQIQGQLDEFEAELGGPLPIALRVWYEIVGSVNFIGSHPEISPPGDSVQRGLIAPPDPLVIYPFEDVSEEYLHALSDGDSGEDGLLLELAPDELHKSNVSGGPSYGIRIPDSGADSEFINEWNETTFVDYVRIALGAAGFPGWHRNTAHPNEIAAVLTRDLPPF
jgi:hypothetical protein